MPFSKGSKPPFIMPFSNDNKNELCLSKLCLERESSSWKGKALLGKGKQSFKR
jgi:hypothetical protein